MKQPPRWLVRTWEFAGVGGMLSALVGGVALSIAVVGFFNTLEDGFEVSSDAITGATATIEVVEDTLSIMDDLLVGAHDLIDEAEQALQDAATVSASVVRLLREELSAQIDSILVPMDGLVGTAAVVDDVLSALSLVGVGYNPDVPLDRGLREVEASLSELPPILEAEADRVFTLATSMVGLSTTVGDFDSRLTRLEIEVGSSRDVLVQYQEAAVGSPAIDR